MRQLYDYYEHYVKSQEVVPVSVPATPQRHRHLQIAAWRHRIRLRGFGTRAEVRFQVDLIIVRTKAHDRVHKWTSSRRCGCTSARSRKPALDGNYHDWPMTNIVVEIERLNNGRLFLPSQREREPIMLKKSISDSVRVHDSGPVKSSQLRRLEEAIFRENLQIGLEVPAICASAETARFETCS